MGRLSCDSGLLPLCARHWSLGIDKSFSFTKNLVITNKIYVLGIMEIKTEQCWRLLLSLKKHEFCVGNHCDDFCGIFKKKLLLSRLGLLYLRAISGPVISSVWQELGQLLASGYQASSSVWVQPNLVNREFHNFFHQPGDLLPDLSRLELCTSLHGFWGLHHAGVSQTEIWRPKDPSLSLSTGNPALRLHQDICRSTPHCLDSSKVS